MGRLFAIVKREGNPVCDKTDSVTTFEVSCSLSLNTVSNIFRKCQREVWGSKSHTFFFNCTILLIICNIFLTMRQSHLFKFFFLQKLTLKCWPNEIHTYYHTITHNNIYNTVFAYNLKYSGKIVLKIFFIFSLAEDVSWPWYCVLHTHCFCACWLLGHLCIRSVKAKQHDSVGYG